MSDVSEQRNMERLLAEASWLDALAHRLVRDAAIGMSRPFRPQSTLTMAASASPLARTHYRCELKATRGAANCST
jgi:hypothetical protein